MKNKNLMKRIMAFIIDYSVVMLLVILVTNTKYLNPTYDEALEKSNNLSSLDNSYVLTTNMFDYYYKDKVITEFINKNITFIEKQIRIIEEKKDRQ